MQNVSSPATAVVERGGFDGFCCVLRMYLRHPSSRPLHGPAAGLRGKGKDGCGYIAPSTCGKKIPFMCCSQKALQHSLEQTRDTVRCEVSVIKELWHRWDRKLTCWLTLRWTAAVSGIKPKDCRDTVLIGGCPFAGLSPSSDSAKEFSQ